MRFDPNLLRIRPEGTPRQTRWFGGLLVGLAIIIIGLARGVLMLIMGYRIPEAWLPAGTYYDPAVPVGTGPGLGSPVGILFLVLMAFGGIALVQGVWQIAAGRRNLTLLRVMLAIAFALFVAGSVAEILLGRLPGQVGQ